MSINEEENVCVIAGLGFEPIAIGSWNKHTSKSYKWGPIDNTATEDTEKINIECICAYVLHVCTDRRTPGIGDEYYFKFTYMIH